MHNSQSDYMKLWIQAVDREIALFLSDLKKRLARRS